MLAVYGAGRGEDDFVSLNTVRRFEDTFFSENIFLALGQHNTNVVHVNILAALNRTIPLEHRNTL